MWPGDYIGHGPTDVSHDRWGLPELMVVHVGRGPETNLDTARQMPAMDKEKSHVWLLKFNISIKSTVPKQKTNDSRDKLRSQRDYK